MFKIKITLFLVCILWSTVIADHNFQGGSGTRQDPYWISTAQQLMSIGSDEYLCTRHYILINNIDLGQYPFTTAVIAPDTEAKQGYQGNPFSGFFNGNGYKIVNMKIDTLSDDDPGNDHNCNLGLFGFVYGQGIIEDVVLEEARITAGQYSYEVGALAGSAVASIRRCSSDGIVKGGVNVGGLVGNQDGEIVECCSTGSVSGYNSVGGLNGINYGHIRDCYSTCSVYGDENVGGLVGSTISSIYSSYSIGKVKGNTSVGGLIGTAYSGESWDCFWDIETSGILGIGAGQGKTTSEMKSVLTYIFMGWNFEWDDNPGPWKEAPGWYPVLSWQGLTKTPDLIDLSQDQAESELVLSGLAVGHISYRRTNSIAPGYTIRQLPAARVMLPEGISVDIEVSLGQGYHDSGSGTAAHPWEIDTAEDLMVLSQSPDDFNKHFIMTADIDLSRYVSDKAFIAYDSDSSNNTFDGIQFTGKFDGNGYRISNMIIDARSVNLSDVSGNDYLGLFGKLGEGGVIEGLRIGNAVVKGDEGSGFVGVLTGDNAGMVINCSVSAEVQSGNRAIGGLAGRNSGSIWGCYSMGSVSGLENSFMIGGLVGHNMRGDINMCYSSVNVTADGNLAGGLIGNNGANITNCYSKGAVACSNTAGGLIANTYRGKVKGCFWDTSSSNQLISAGGIGKATFDMNQRVTFLEEGWDFISMWWINDGCGYPKLFWQPKSDINNDSQVNMVDFNIISASWLSGDCEIYCEGLSDLSCDGKVDLNEFIMMVDMWLAGPSYSK